MNWRNCFKAIIFTLLIFANINPDDCSICLDALNSETLITLPCNHSFCLTCFDTWATFNNSDILCPNCRFCMGHKKTYNKYKKLIFSYNSKNLLELIKYSIKIYNKKLDEFWKEYLTNKIKTLLITKYRVLGKTYEKQESSKERFEFLKTIIIALHESNLYAGNNHLRSILGRYLKETTSQLYDKEILLEAIDFFKKDKAFLRIVKRQYLELYN